MKRFGTRLIFALILSEMLFLAACKKNPIEPQPPAEPDTTSHKFAWQMFTLGDGNSSVLNDVAIINDSLVYAVGEMYLKDTSGRFDPSAYNLAKWDGQSWTLTRIMFPLCDANGNQQALGPYPANGVFSFSNTNLWVSCGVSLLQWNGQTFQPNCMTLGYGQRNLGKMWGTKTGLYLLGTNGFIAHYSSGIWLELSSRTGSDFRDVWGITDVTSGQESVVAVASSPSETKVLSLSGQSVADTLSWPILEPLLGVWSSNSSNIYVCGAGVWQHTNSGWRQTQGLPNAFYQSIRGTANNDIFTVSWNGIIAHYNGATWHVFPEIPSDFSFYSVAVSQDIVVAVGFTGGMFVDKACAVVGRRVR